MLSGKMKNILIFRDDIYVRVFTKVELKQKRKKKMKKLNEAN